MASIPDEGFSRLQTMANPSPLGEGGPLSQEEAFTLALELEQSELKAVYYDLVLMGRVAVKFMAGSANESLSLSTHQEGLLNGIIRFVPEGRLRRQAEAWLAEQGRKQRPQQ